MNPPFDARLQACTELVDSTHFLCFRFSNKKDCFVTCVMPYFPNSNWLYSWELVQSQEMARRKSLLSHPHPAQSWLIPHTSFASSLATRRTVLLLVRRHTSPTPTVCTPGNLFSPRRWPDIRACLAAHGGVWFANQSMSFTRASHRILLTSPKCNSQCCIFHGIPSDVQIHEIWKFCVGV
jgi:hypothetical protein